MIGKTVFPVALVAIVAYFYLNGNERESTVELFSDEMKNNIISAWQDVIRESSKQFRRVAVGVNGNVDLIVPAIELLEALNVSPAGKADHATLDSLGKLQDVFALFFSKGSAAERYFGDAALYMMIVETAMSLKSKQLFVGGNAALMANKISTLIPGAQVQFVGPVGPVLTELFPKSIQIPGGSRVEQDEVHLIMEYKVGDKWGKDVAPVATRFITSHDQSNAQVNMLETFFYSLNDFKPDLVLMSGLHMMEGLDGVTFTKRLQVLKDGLSGIVADIPIHLELASMAKADYLKDILNDIVPKVTSLGLNEQELAFSSAVGKGPHSELFSEQKGQPEIYKISDMILWLLQTYGRTDQRKSSRLTRVHFHSLTFHIVGVVPSRWGNTNSSVAAGARLAGRQACDVDRLSVSDVDLKLPQGFKLYSQDKERTFDTKNPVISWEHEGFLFSFSPVLVCKHPEKTVGLGDAISSTGLLFSEFLST